MNSGRLEGPFLILLGSFGDFELSQISSMTDGGVNLQLDFSFKKIYWLPHSEDDSVRIYYDNGTSHIFLGNGGKFFNSTIPDEADLETEFREISEDIDYIE